MDAPYFLSVYGCSESRDTLARRAIEQSQKEGEKWDKMVNDFNYESAAASLQKLLDTLN